jgi:hypothetical protein
MLHSSPIPCPTTGGSVATHLPTHSLPRPFGGRHGPERLQVGRRRLRAGKVVAPTHIPAAQASYYCQSGSQSAIVTLLSITHISNWANSFTYYKT